VDEDALRNASALLRCQIKAHIARSAYGKTDFYTVLNEQDAEFQQALHAVEDGRALLAQGISME
jgi:carboxyl-terminal processing protease